MGRSTEFYRVLPSFFLFVASVGRGGPFCIRRTEFYRVLPSFTEFFFPFVWVSLRPPPIRNAETGELGGDNAWQGVFTEFYRVLPSFFLFFASRWRSSTEFCTGNDPERERERERENGWHSAFRRFDGLVFRIPNRDRNGCERQWTKQNRERERETSFASIGRSMGRRCVFQRRRFA